MKSSFLRWFIPFNKEFLGYFFPTTLYFFLSSFVPLLDNIMIGRLGPVQISALDLGGKVLYSLHVIFFGISTAVSIFLVRHPPHKPLSQLLSYIRISLLLTFGLGMFTALLMTSFSGVYLKFFTFNPQVLQSAQDYLLIVLWAYPLAGLCATAVAITRSLGKPYYSLLALLASSLSNILANYILIYGKWGFPALGMQGAAIATVLAYVTQVSFFAWFLLRNRTITTAISDHLLPLKSDWVVFQKLWGKIVIVVLSDSVWIFAFMLINRLFAQADILAYSAYGVMNTLLGFSFFLFGGYTTTAFHYVGKHLKTGHKEKAFQLSLECLSQMLVWSLAYALLLRYAFSALTWAFALGEFTPILKDLLDRLILLFPIMMGSFLLFKGIFRAGGDVLFVYSIEMINIWLIALPVAYWTINIGKWEIVNSFFTMRLLEHSTIFFVLYRFFSKKWIRSL